MLIRNTWILVTREVELELEGKQEYQPILGFSKDWIDEDFNINGIRECMYGDENYGWISAKWVNMQDSYYTDNETKPTHIFIPELIKKRFI